MAGSKKDKANSDLIKDSRFSSVYSDPRFKRPNLKNAKIKVDDRFSKKELENLNQGSKHVKVDRYGRTLDINDSKVFEKYYEAEEAEQSEDESDGNVERSENSSEKEDSQNKLLKGAIPKTIDKDSLPEDSEEDSESDSEGKVEVDASRGIGVATDSESSDSDSELDDTDSEEIESDIEIENTKPAEGDPTSRLALVNLDWDNITAVDILATLSSFIPSSGSIIDVAIYPSEFGKEQMRKEEIEGPPRELFQSKRKSKRVEEDNDSSSSDSEIDIDDKEEIAKAAKKLYEEDDGTEDYDSKALRRYQLQRLRYYYAVVKCDSVATARNIYQNCDGTEYESTANIFDLRYIPEDMEFDISEASDSCSHIPSTYKPTTFITEALQHSKVKLTWDQTSKARADFSSRSFSQREIEEMDFKAYIASDSESEENQEGLKEKYAGLVGNKNFDAFEEESGDVDMEITFDPALKEVTEESNEDAEETTIERYRRKEKERRKQRMKKFKEAQEAEKEQKEKLSTKKKQRQQKNPEQDKESEKNRAELELLMMDEEGNDHVEHFDMREIKKQEKLNKKKGKKAKNVADAESSSQYVPDLNDPRFQEVFEDHSFAIDPTKEDFRKSETMKKIMEERSKRSRVSEGSSKKRKTVSSNAYNSNDTRNIIKKLKQKQKQKHK